ncbi:MULTISPECIES: group II intron maturase-specific domain-containing protein [unclassified Acetobacterium]|jgi:RNA-directed DNA polymerase|uniref:group II intron maturase-specific domain-containing protein n=1 Tax=unclassified Acetobacterium TaxID=2638182 RepID=UPI00269B3AA4|nr:group II intron maturase-specific domain-containing protein [Acetobacterium sp. K1/6]MDZ5726765.1 group II intron maturase-specific domain-containing protein [Acetobacterium sp. K1/6]
MNYFTKFCSREARKEIDYVNKTLVQWLKRKYKTVKKSKRKAWRMLVHLANSKTKLFYHWEEGIKPTIG